ncbi:unnamed protein product [Soboliphyme baturini]|uniref:OBG-type G domain-containing protein n=1 Tax=Soboliphyme baturini TaxID=241478 RepID=A0A183J0M4_9BILA|nr:unnamed protein product [Soboliphyme baturini]
MRKPTAPGNASQHFVDYRRVKTIGGRGGDGMIAFLRLFCVPKAGPCGGDGGNGGHVIFQADAKVKSLAHLHSVLHAKDGENGKSKSCHGKSADHLYIKVPLGTKFTRVGEESCSQLNSEGQIFIASRGGAGGHGNQFYLSNENRFPVYAEAGALGEEAMYDVQLCILADAGLIGYPNAGKSSLLRAISRARPKVASYPFTTVKPHVGIIEYPDYTQLSVADIPGILPGAHENRGLGIEFLRHIERCRCLVFVIDLSLPEPWNQLKDLKMELSFYNAELLDRHSIVIGNKIDVAGAIDSLRRWQQMADGEVVAISAKERTGTDGIPTLLRALCDRVS